jgi:hypothetical protein
MNKLIDIETGSCKFMLAWRDKLYYVCVGEVNNVSGVFDILRGLHINLLVSYIREEMRHEDI